MEKTIFLQDIKRGKLYKAASVYYTLGPNGLLYANKGPAQEGVWDLAQLTVNEALNMVFKEVAELDEEVKTDFEVIEEVSLHEMKPKAVYIRSDIEDIGRYRFIGCRLYYADSYDGNDWNWYECAMSYNEAREAKFIPASEKTVKIHEMKPGERYMKVDNSGEKGTVVYTMRLGVLYRVFMGEEIKAMLSYNNAIQSNFVPVSE